MIEVLSRLRRADRSSSQEAARLKTKAIEAVARRLNLEIIRVSSDGITTARARRPGSPWWGNEDKDSDVILKAFRRPEGVRVETWDRLELTDVYNWSE